MCGITGIWYFDPNKIISQVLVEKMSNKISHRGPDQEGYYLQGNVGFGFRRLSIIDLLGSNQPLSNIPKNMWLVFNGEIYNYKEIRATLLSQGHAFTTVGDAEVILHCYEQMGIDFLEKLKGMFAFALWDKLSERMVLAVDPFGKKPLYYSLTEDYLIFGSELKALLEFPGISKELNLKSLDEYFTYGCISAPRTIFSSIQKVAPGSYLIIDNKGKAKTQKYWKPTFYPQQYSSKSISEKNLIENLRIYLEQSVRRRLTSDVPVGAFLSGGVDSSAVVSQMVKHSSKKIHTFTIGFKDAEYNEIPFSYEVANYLSTIHHTDIIGEGLTDIIIQLARQFDEPLADPSIVPTFLVSKLASNWVKVVLSGDGGDEIFGGYKAYQLAYQAEWNRLKTGQQVPELEDEYRQIKDFPIEECYICFYKNEREELFLPHLKIENKAERKKKAADRVMSRHDLLTRLQYVDLRTYLPFDILAKVDRASMLNSLEVRCPLLDIDLVQFMSTIPSAFKFDGFETKIILKRAVEPLLPPGILNRKKQGFSMPLDRMLRFELCDLVEEILFDGKLERRGLFNQIYLRKIVNEHYKGFDHHEAIWCILCFELWARNYLS